MEEKSKRISLLCPVCGNDQFASLDVDHDDLLEAEDDVKVKCSDCGCVLTKSDILFENSEKVSIAVEEFEEEIIEDVTNDLKDMFKRLKF